jgi:hypothetical protein
MYEASADGGVKILMEQSHVKTEDLPGIIRNIRSPDETVLTSTEASASLSGGYRFIPSARVGWGVLASAHGERSLDPGEVRAVYLRPPY